MTFTTYWVSQLVITAMVVWVGGVRSGRTHIAVATALGLGPFVALYRLFVETIRSLK
jgi:hypothetical protein